MKDKQGIVRGKCMTPGCECSEYVAPQDSNSARCDYCDHVPVKHVKMIKLGACMDCECQSYESEEIGSYSNCGYCDCPAQRHKGAEKLLNPARRPVQQFSAQAMLASGGPPGKPASMAPMGGPPTCKVPGCTKPCFVDKDRVHEFCGKRHAELYKSMMQQAPQPSTAPLMYKQPPSFANASSGAMQVSSSQQMGYIQAPPSQQTGHTQPPPSQQPTMMCVKCQAKPANPNHKWCQDCYLKSQKT